MRRHLIGILAGALLALGVYFSQWPMADETWQTWTLSACWRLGPALAILWLAYDDARRMPRWLLPVVLLVLAALALRPKLFLLAIPVVVALAILRPRFGRRQANPRSES